jgi:phosphohistidine phosphatase
MLLRHAKAGFDLTGQADAERVLTHSGKQDAIKLAYKLKGRNDRVDLFFCSPAARTRQTLEAITEIMAPGGALELVSNLYQASEEAVLQLVQSVPIQFQTVMVIGHNPSMTQLANLLARDLRLDHLPTCGLVVIHFEHDAWSQLQPGSGQVAWFDFPKNDYSIL